MCKLLWSCIRDSIPRDFDALNHRPPNSNHRIPQNQSPPPSSRLIESKQTFDRAGLATSAKALTRDSYLTLSIRRTRDFTSASTWARMVLFSVGATNLSWQQLAQSAEDRVLLTEVQSWPVRDRKCEWFFRVFGCWWVCVSAGSVRGIRLTGWYPVWRIFKFLCCFICWRRRCDCDTESARQNLRLFPLPPFCDACVTWHTYQTFCPAFADSKLFLFYPLSYYKNMPHIFIRSSFLCTLIK